MTKYILLICLFFIVLTVKAQTWEFGVSAGGAGYMGDLNANNPVKVTGFSFGGLIQRNFDGYWSAKISFTHGTIAGNDASSSDQQFRARNLSFSTSLEETALIGEFNFLNYIPKIGKNVFTPFIFAGVATVAYNPTAVYQGQTYDLRPLETEGQKKPYSSSAFSIPYGVGIKYNIAGALTLTADFGYRNPNTDYLDDVSRYYPNTANMTPVQKALSDRSGENTGVYIGTPGSQRGDLNARDSYFFTQITLSYTFLTSKCYFER